MPKQGKPARLDYSSEFRLLRLPPCIIVPDKLVLLNFDAKQHTHTPLVECIDPVRASVFDIAQQSEPYRNIGKMHVLYSFNFVEVASRDLQI